MFITILYHPATVCSAHFDVKMAYLQNEDFALPEIVVSTVCKCKFAILQCA